MTIEFTLVNSVDGRFIAMLRRPTIVLRWSTITAYSRTSAELSKMSNKISAFRGALVTNTEPATLPGQEPIIGRHVTLERLTAVHFLDLWDNLGSHPDLWTWWPDEPCKTPSEFSEYMDVLLTLSDDLAVYAVLLPSGPKHGESSRHRVCPVHRPPLQPRR